VDDGRIDAGLIERIRARLQDDWRRTGDGDYTRMPRELRRTLPGSGGSGLAGMLLSAVLSHEPTATEPLKPIEPLRDAQVAKVEKGLGFALPTQLRQLYLEVGDGGFGPYAGIRRLANWAADYAKLRTQLPAERGRDWPEGLLPIVYVNGRRVCVERDSGRVLLWTKPPKRVSEPKWLASFVPLTDSLQAWLEAWVDTPTVLEGGPEGGWTPQTDEVERRRRVEAQAEARRAAEAAKARSFTPASLPPLDPDLLERVRGRAMDPERRTYLAGAEARSSPVSLADLESELGQNAGAIPPPAVAGLGRLLSGLRRLGPATAALPRLNVSLGPSGGMVMMSTGAGGRLGAPASEMALERADRELGVRVPEPLRQLLKIADGGFGPGSGLLPLADMLSLCRTLTATPQGPGGEMWPARLLPIWQADDEIGCLDLEGGAITTYDPTRMQDIHGGYWRRSFATEHPSLAALMEDWLRSPTFSEQVARHEQRSDARQQRLERAREGDDGAAGDQDA
jgi:hypothetical protein